MQSSMVMFTVSVFDQKYSFWVNLVQKNRIVNLSWNFVAILIWICKIQWWCSLFPFSTEYAFFLVNLVQKITIISLCWILVPGFICVCTIQWDANFLCFRLNTNQWWCSFFLFLAGNTLFRQIWFKTSKLSVEAEIWS